MTSQGSAYGRFRRAIDRRNPTAALSAAAELGTLPLSNALELLLLLADGDEARFPRAALRWHGRYCREVRGVEPAEAHAVLSLLLMLSGERRREAARALAELLARRRSSQLSQTLLEWAMRGTG